MLHTIVEKIFMAVITDSAAYSLEPNEASLSVDNSAVNVLSQNARAEL